MIWAWCIESICWVPVARWSSDPAVKPQSPAGREWAGQLSDSAEPEASETNLNHCPTRLEEAPCSHMLINGESKPDKHNDNTIYNL